MSVDRIVIKDSGTTYILDGREVTAKEYRRRYPLPKSQQHIDAPGRVGIKPKESDALAVHPLDVPEAIEDAKRKGVPTDFTPDGSPIITSRAHQKAYLRAYGYRNKDGGYGD
jgi:hypothetical protein